MNDELNGYWNSQFIYKHEMSDYILDISSRRGHEKKKIWKGYHKNWEGWKYKRIWRKEEMERNNTIDR